MANFVYGDTNGVIVFDKAIQEEKTYLGKEDGFNILKALSDNHPDDHFYLIQHTENYKQIRDSGVFNRMFKNKNVHFPADEALLEYPKAIEQTKGGSELAEDALHVSDIIYSELMSLDPDDRIKAIITVTVPSEMPFKGRTKDPDNQDINLNVSDDFAIGAYLNDFIYRSELPLLSFHVDERFVYTKNKLVYTNRVPDLILGFDEREIDVEVPAKVYPDGTISDRTKTLTVFGTFGNNDHISMLNYHVSKGVAKEEVKLGAKSNFDNDEHKQGPIIKIFYNQLRKNFTDDKNSNFAFVDRLKLLNDFGIFDSFTPEELQLYTNVKYNDQDIVNEHNAYFNQSLPKQKMIDMMYNTKYGLILPNSKKTSMSQKIFENLSIGVIPFYIQNDDAWYGSKYYTTVLRNLRPDILGVKNASEMRQRIDDLENDPDLKASLIEELLSNWDDGFVDGSVISDKIINATDDDFVLNRVNLARGNQYPVYSIDGPKFSGKTTKINEQIKGLNLKDYEYLIVHSDISLPNDYNYFTKIHRGWLNKDWFPDVDWNKIKVIFIDRSFMSEHVYGDIWESTVNGTIADLIDDFNWPIIEVSEVYSSTNISLDDVKLLAKTYHPYLRIFKNDNAYLDSKISQAREERTENRFSRYEEQTFKISNRIFTTLMFNTKDDILLKIIND